MKTIVEVLASVQCSVALLRPSQVFLEREERGEKERVESHYHYWIVDCDPISSTARHVLAKVRCVTTSYLWPDLPQTIFRQDILHQIYLRWWSQQGKHSNLLSSSCSLSWFLFNFSVIVCQLNVRKTSTFFLYDFMTLFWLTIKCVGPVEKFQKVSAHHWFRFLTIKSNDLIIRLSYLCEVWLHLKDAFMRIRNVPGERGWLTNPVGLLSLHLAGLPLAQAAVAEGWLLQPPLPLHGGAARLPCPRSPVEHGLESTPERGSSSLPPSPSFFYLHAGGCQTDLVDIWLW